MSPFRALAATFLLGALPTLAAAGCTGPTLLDRFSDAQRRELDAAANAMPYGTGLFWQADKGDASLTLIGTMHLYDPRHDRLMDRIGDRVAAADLLLVEMTPDEERKMRRAMVTDPSLVFITDGPTLPERLSDDLWSELADAARARQMPTMLAAKSQPWFLSMSLAVPPCAMDDLVAGRRGLDHMVMDAAQEADVPMRSLEEWTTLPDHFRAIPVADQIDMLRLTLLEPGLQSEAFVAMLDSYFAGRVAEIREMSRLSTALLDTGDRSAALEGWRLTEELLLDARNRAWLPRITEAAGPAANIIVAVGAAHLPGEEGLLRLLEHDGWTIRPMD